MKHHPSLISLFVSLILASPAPAGEVIKANNNTSLTSTDSWVGEVVPTAVDVAVWDSNFTTTNQITMDGSPGWLGIRAAPGAVPTIRNSSGATITLGSAGIDMSASGHDFVCNPNITAAANQTWNIAADRELRLANGVAGAGVTVTKTGAGTLSLGGSLLYEPNFKLDGGTLKAANSTVVLSGTLSGTGGGLLVDSNGSLTLSGPNSFSGGTTLTAGQLNLNHGSALGAGPLTITGGSLGNSSGSSLTLAGNSQSWNGDFSYAGPSDLDLGSGAITLAGSRTLSVNAGTLTLSGSLIGAAGSSLTKSGAGILRVVSGGDLSLPGALAVNAGTLQLDGGATTCGTTAGRLTLGGTGTLELNGGILTTPAVTGSGASAVVFNGGELRPLAGTPTFMSGVASARVAAGGAVIEPDGYQITLSQALSHDPALGATADGGLRVRGEFGGVLTLTGASTYTGPTVVERGSLKFGAGGSLSNSPLLEVGPGALLDGGFAGYTVPAGQTLRGSGELAGKITVAAGGTLSPGSPGNSYTAINMAAGTLVLQGTAEMEIRKTFGGIIDSVLGLDEVTYGGTLTVYAQAGTVFVNGDSFELFESLSYNGSFATLNLPDVSAQGLFWDTAMLAVDGTITASNTLPAPVFSPPGGSFFIPPTVTISSLQGSMIHYTTDGSNPVSSGTRISMASPATGIAIPSTPGIFTLKAYATAASLLPSAVETEVYQMLGPAVWVSDADGYWTDPGRWADGVPADAVGLPADFSSLTLTGNRAVTLDASVTVGTLNFADLGNTYGWRLEGTSTLTLAAVAITPAIQVDNQTTTLAVPLAGTQGLFKSGPGALILTGANSYAGQTTIQAGKLQLGDGVVQPTINSTYQIAANAVLRLQYGPAGSIAQTWSKYTGAGTFELASGKDSDAGWGALALPAAFTGTLVIERGRVANNSAGTAFGEARRVAVRQGGQLALFNAPGGATVTANLAIAGTGYGEVEYPGALRLPDGWGTLAGAITLAGDAAICGSWSGSAVGTITAPISGPADADLTFVCPPWITTYTFALTGANTYAGNTTVDRGVLRLGASAVIPDGAGKGDLTINATGSLNLNGFSETINGLQGAGSVTTTSAGSVLTVGGGNRSSVFSGSISGALALIKTGSGTLALNGSCGYTGATALNVGSLLVNGSLTASPALSAATGATLGGSGNVTGSVTIPAGATLAPGITGPGTLSTGALTLGGTYACQIDGANCDKLAVTGDLNLTGSTLAVEVLAGGNGGGPYLIATYSGALTGTFPSVPGYIIDTSTANQIKLVKSASSGYDAWANSWPGLTDKTPGGDPDKDGISNLMEYVIGGDPRASSTSYLPKSSIRGGNLVLSYQRSDASEADTTQTGQWSTDLLDWSHPAITPVLINENGTAPDDMEIRIPLTNAVDGKLFGRLHVANP